MDFEIDYLSYELNKEKEINEKSKKINDQQKRPIDELKEKISTKENIKKLYEILNEAKKNM